MKKISEKYNEACIKVFDMLKLLSKGTAYYSDIIELFNPDENNPTAGAHVILNKYLNTLKIFGINIYKSKNIYHLQNSFYSLNLDKNDIKMLQLLKTSGLILSNTKQKEQFDNFVHDVEMRLTSTSRELLNSTNDSDNLRRSEYFTKYRDLISKCEGYCNDNSKLEISFYADSKEYKLICTPKDITFINQNIYLSVFNHLSRQIFDIPIDKITAIKQMPVLSATREAPMTVVYKIRNNLAKAYRLREWETTDGKIDEDGWLTIVNNNENFDVLIKRLMRYDVCCQVVSTKNFRERMLSTIDETLANYE